MTEYKLNRTTAPLILKLRTRWRLPPPAPGRFISEEKTVETIELEDGWVLEVSYMF